MDQGLGGACFGGNKEIIEIMIEKGANDWNRSLNVFKEEIIKFIGSILFPALFLEDFCGISVQ